MRQQSDIASTDPIPLVNQMIKDGALYRDMFYFLLGVLEDKNDRDWTKTLKACFDFDLEPREQLHAVSPDFERPV